MPLKFWSLGQQLGPELKQGQIYLLCCRLFLPVAGRVSLEHPGRSAARGDLLLVLAMQCLKEAGGPRSCRGLRPQTAGKAAPLCPWSLQCFLLPRRNRGTRGWRVWPVELKWKGRSRPLKTAISRPRASPDQCHSKASMCPQPPAVRLPEQKLLWGPCQWWDNVTRLPRRLTQLSTRVALELLYWEAVQEPTVKEVKVTAVCWTETAVFQRGECPRARNQAVPSDERPLTDFSISSSLKIYSQISDSQGLGFNLFSAPGTPP